jgi:AP-4 complex subunit epsilon-1
MSGMHLSKEFFELLKAIGESKSKQEEDRIIQREIACLKKKMETKVAKVTIGGGGPPQNQLNANKKKAKEFLVRLLYVGKYYFYISP